MLVGINSYTSPSAFIIPPQWLVGSFRRGTGGRPWSRRRSAAAGRGRPGGRNIVADPFPVLKGNARGHGAPDHKVLPDLAQTEAAVHIIRALDFLRALQDEALDSDVKLPRDGLDLLSPLPHKMGGTDDAMGQIFQVT